MNKRRVGHEERKSESLSLDRCGLPCIPNTKGRENILLLSLQHNLIVRIDSLSNLNQLLVLNLYDNKIEQITGLECLSNLRVLMLGKNRLRGIEGLDNLHNLDVLDLHGNQIHFADNLGELKNLRVLNLAANSLSSVDGLHNLQNLRELNLKRNHIENVSSFHGLPKLQKLYLSNNCIQTIRDVQKILEMKSLEEIALDGNAITLDPCYVRTIVGSCSSLKILDGNVLDISHLDETVRREAAAWMKMQKAKDEKAGVSVWRYTEIEPIQNARKQWEEMQLQKFKIAERERQVAVVRPLTRPQLLDTEWAVPHSATSPQPRQPRSRTRSQRKRSSVSAQPKSNKISSVSLFSTRAQIIRQIYRGAEYSPSREQEVPKIKSKKSPKRSGSVRKFKDLPSPHLSSCNLDGGTIIGSRIPSMTYSDTDDAQETMLNAPKQKVNKSPRKTNPKSTFREEGKDFLIKIDENRLEVYGPSAVKRLTEKSLPSEACKQVTNILFNLVIFDTLPPVFKKLRTALPNAISLMMKETNISCLGQLNMFGILERIYSLDIRPEGNGLTRKPNWRLYAIYRLHHLGLRVINGKEISVADVEEAEKEYGVMDGIISSVLPSLVLKQDSRSTDSLCEPSDVSSSNEEEDQNKQVIRSVLKYNQQMKNEAVRLRNRQSLHGIVKDGLSSEQSLSQLESNWNTVLDKLILLSFKEMADMDSYKKQCLQKVKEELGI